MNAAMASTSSDNGLAAASTTTLARNATHAAKVRGWLEEAVAFGDRESALFELDAIVRLCDRHAIEFSDFAALDEIILQTGEAEQERRASAAAGKRKREDNWPAGCTRPTVRGELHGVAELDAPIDGEAGSIVQLDGYSAAAAVGVCCAAGKYLALFERPLLALGTFREARSRDGRCVAASHGMAHLLLELGYHRAAAELAYGFFAAAEGVPLAEAADEPPTASEACSFVFLLRELLGYFLAPNDDSRRQVVTNLLPFLRSGAASAARSLSRQLLYIWQLDLHGNAIKPDVEHVKSPEFWQVYACEEAEPVLSKLRFALCTKLMRSLGAADAGDVDTVASLAIHCLHVGFAVPNCVSKAAALSDYLEEETLLNGLLERLYEPDLPLGWLLQSAAGGTPCPGACFKLELITALVLLGCYRPLYDAREGDGGGVEGRIKRAVCAAAAQPAPEGSGCRDALEHACQAAHVPTAYACFCAHVLQPIAREKRAAAIADEVIERRKRQPPAGSTFAEHVEALHVEAGALPIDVDALDLIGITPAVADHADNPVGEFYSQTLYPTWSHIETFGFAPATIGDRLRRQYRNFEWPHDGIIASPLGEGHRILVAGAGSGHQVAQLLLTTTRATVVALDLSAHTLAYSEQQLQRCAPAEAHRVKHVVGDIEQLSVTRPFHQVACIGVLHHCPNPAKALGRLARALEVGGVMQLATYSRLSVHTWLARARKLVAALSAAVEGEAADAGRAAPPPLVGPLAEGGEILRRPTPAEVRRLRRCVFDLADADRTERVSAFRPDGVVVGKSAPRDDELDDTPASTARLLLKFDEFYSYGGVLDLLFHPLERCFTLLDLQAMAAAAGLKVVGVFFARLDVDRKARRAYRDKWPDDAAQADLARWHELEEADNQLFGRMHCLWLQRMEVSEVPTAAELAAAAAAASLGSYVVGDEETPQGNEPLLTIKVVTPAGNEIFFGCKKTTPLSKLMNAYCQQLGVTLDETRFLFDGQRINEFHTPEVLEMEDGDVIDVIE